MAKFIGQTGLVYLWGKIKNYVANYVKITSSTGKDTITAGNNSVDIYDWAQASTKPSYNLDEISDGTTNKAFTSTEKSKLENIASGAEVNQNAFSNVKVGSSTIAADAKTDTLELAAGSKNLVTLTPDTSGDKVTIEVEDDLSKYDNTTSGFITTADVPVATSTTPKMDGTADVGSETAWAKGDHVHPTDTSRASSTHTHGNIGNGGTLTDTAAAAATDDQVVIRDASNNKIQTSTIKGTDVADAVDKKHSHSTLTLSTTAQAYDGTHTLQLPASDPYSTARTPSSHTHGNITNDGKLQTDDVTIANGDKLVITDSSDSAKVARASISFDGSTTTKALTQKGTFETFNNYSHPTTTAVAAAAVKVGNDANGHVVLGDALSKSDVGLGNVDNKSSATIRSEITSSNVTTALGYTPVNPSVIGAASGVCPLDSNTKIDAQYLPSYVDDVVEAYIRSGQTALSSSWLATGSASGTAITPEAGKIYVLMNSDSTYPENTQFRWGGSTYVKLNDGGISELTTAEMDTATSNWA